ncbi:NAD-dependent epimerase/dehydratase family protein [Staphylococcus intermedius]|uniref:Putative NAD-dependent epimerase/dehydratase n=1 Tax=Staphylococcus intermedius NCTC 11048 TaxID=1141106 RepID=A0A380G3G1_STAIN|nr:NAD(P)-dependent oxidoreductase [Staphylococcus intermedius]PCF64355.1 epimerase [Staphylococcus intermedius]PCF79071.1 epimerase [Staphylococcus intermedius]PCF80044.1 epimerase [Staphylococcus intermedius]PCF86176.1 epimerase [Staphylococcus intermedius]PCF89295.1 epimerase [Staphylococcus intermedius]
MTKIFVTGATGLIGMRLTERLIQEGHDVAGFTTSENGKARLEKVGAQAFIGNILEPDTIEAAIKAFQPEVIMHQITDLKNVDMAANTKVRVEGTRHLVDSALKYDVQHIISQSLAFMYEPGDTLATETTPLDTNSSGDRKITVDGVIGVEGESQRLAHAVILRYGMMYGPGTWFGKDGMIYNQFKEGNVQLSKGITSYVHIDDTVEAAIKALNFEAGIYNVTDDEPIDGETWAAWYAEQLNVSPQIEFLEAQPFERGADNQKYKAQGGKLLYSTWRDGMDVNE